MSITTDPNDPGLEEIGPDGMQKRYLVLPDGSRQAYIRPFRMSYRHVGIRPQWPTRELTDDENERYAGAGYALWEEYPESEAPVLGKFWTKRELESGCSSMTSMNRQLAETYAVNPKFYGATFCVKCGGHFPVREFVWEGTDERVGS